MIEVDAPAEEEPEEAAADSPEEENSSARYSGSTDQSLFESDNDVWDSSSYVASTSDLQFTDGRYRPETGHDSKPKLSSSSGDARLGETADPATQFQFALDDMRSQLERAANQKFSGDMAIGDIIRITASSVSAGFLAWLLRAGPLVASVVSTLPAWSRFDPLPVLMSGKDEEAQALDTEEKEEDEQEVKARRILENQPHTSQGRST